MTRGILLSTDILIDTEDFTVIKDTDYCRRKGNPIFFPPMYANFIFYVRAVHIQPCPLPDLFLHPPMPFAVQIHCVQKAPNPSRLRVPFRSISNIIVLVHCLCFIHALVIQTTRMV